MKKFRLSHKCSNWWKIGQDKWSCTHSVSKILLKVNEPQTKERWILVSPSDLLEDLEDSEPVRAVIYVT